MVGVSVETGAEVEFVCRSGAGGLRNLERGESQDSGDSAKKTVALDPTRESHEKKVT